MTPRREGIDAGARCLIYTRVSTDRQATPEKASLDAQLAACRQLAAKHGHANPALWDDPGRSGTDPRRLDELVAWCEAHRRRDGLVVVYSPDRFARLGSEEVGYYTIRLRKAGWDIRYVDLARTGNRMVDGTVGALRAELGAEESRIKSDRSLTAIYDDDHAAEFKGGKPPLGYDVGPDKRLVANADKARVKKAFEKFVGGATLDQVAEIVGWKHASSARAMLANPVYVGAVDRGHRRRKKVLHENGQRPRLIEGAHKGIVDRRTWERVQDRLRSPNPRYAHGGKRPAPKGALPYILSGIARCTCALGRTPEERFGNLQELAAEDKELPELRKLCGGGGIPAGATEAERLKWRSYRCKRCNGAVPQQALEAAVLGAVAKFLVRELKTGAFERRLDRWVESQLGAGDSRAVERERADIAVKRARLVPLVMNGNAAAVEQDRKFGDRLRELEATREERPSESAIRKQADEMLARQRWIVKKTAGPLHPKNVSEGLATYRPIIAEVQWDRDDRTVQVKFGIGWWSIMMSAGADVQARRRRGSPDHHTSAYSAPWRARASLPGARRRT